MNHQPQEQEDWRSKFDEIWETYNFSMTGVDREIMADLISTEIERAKSEREEEILRWARKNAQPTNSGFEDEQRRIFLNDLINFLSTPQDIKNKQQI